MNSAVRKNVGEICNSKIKELVGIAANSWSNKMDYLLSRITLNPEINHGKPSIRSTRYLVEGVLQYLAGGDSIDDILAEFPDLEKDDILACIAYDTHCQA